MSIGTAAETQLRVIHALALRETRTRFGAHQLGYLWSILEPVLWVLTFYVVFTIANRPSPTGMDIVTFITTGLIPYDLFTRTLNNVSQAVNGNRALLFYPQVQPLDLAFSRTLLEFSTSIVVLVVIMGAHGMIVGGGMPQDPLNVMLGVFLASLLGLSVGLVFCSLGVVSNVVDRVRGPLLRPMFWLSGLFFTADSLPDRARAMLLYNPVLHTVELVRGGWFPEYSVQHARPGYVVAWIIGFLFLGLVLERVVRRRILTV